MTLYAQKLLAWFGIYKITATQYDAGLPPKAQRRGLFVDALEELVTYGY
jgi:hypothetical protein